MKKKLVYFLSILLLAMCTKEEITSREYPRVRTLEIGNITASGALFRGTVFYAPGPMIDHGFIWGDIPTLEPNKVDEVSLGPMSGTGEFEARVERSMVAGRKYYARAYAKTTNYDVYGDIISFVSLGSEAPAITALDPSKGRILDTILVKGRNFSRISSVVTVQFDTIRSTILSTSDSLLTVIVPETLAKAKANVTVTVLGNISNTSIAFELIGPKIESVSSLLVAPCDTLRISGHDFGNHMGQVSVRLGGEACEVLSVTEQTITINVPIFTPPSQDILLEVVSSNIPDTFAEALTYKAPSIQSVSPLTNITFLDTLTLTGVSLPLCTSLAIKIGGINTPVIFRSPTKVKTIIPAELTATQNTALISFGSGKYNYQFNFDLAPPQITSITPSSATFGDLIVIAGKNFHPNVTNNLVDIGTRPATIISATSSRITVRINNESAYCSYSNRCNSVIVQVNQQSVESNAFSLKKPILDSFNPPVFTSPGLVTVTGQNFSTLALNTVQLGMDESIPLSYSANSITFDLTTYVMSNHNPYFSANRTDSIAVLIAGGDPNNPNSLFSNKLPVDVNYEGPWTQKNSFSSATGSQNSFAIGSKGYLIGGTTGTNAYSNQVWEYTPATDSWQRLGDFPGGARVAAVSYSLNGKGYLALGQDDGVVYDDFWEYDPLTDSWRQLPSYPGGRRRYSFAFTIGNTGYIGGGELFQGGDPTTPIDFWSFDHSAEIWLQRQNLPTAFQFAHSFSTSTAGYVYQPIRMWKYDPIGNVWEPKAPLMIFGSISIDQAVGNDGKGYFFDRANDRFFEYDPAQDSWLQRVSLNTLVPARVSFAVNSVIYYGLGYYITGGNVWQFMNDFFALDMTKYPDP